MWKLNSYHCRLREMIGLLTIGLGIQQIKREWQMQKQTSIDASEQNKIN